MTVTRWMLLAGSALVVTPSVLVVSPALADTTVDDSPQAVVATMEQLFGVHPGQRRNHTKGTCAEGSFTGLAAGQALSRSALFSGKAVPVVARFSLPGGNPHAPDAAPSPRGLALEFRLPDGALQHMTMLNTPMFGAATPASFHAALLAKLPDPKTGKPDPAKLAAFKAAHPDSIAQGEFLKANRPPAGYELSAYYGIHAFRFVDAAGHGNWVRWRFVPHDGEHSLTAEQMQGAPRDFLERRLIERAKDGPVQWDMIVTLGEAGDSTTDPTQSWPTGRREVKVGTLTLTRAMPQAGAACEKINYDPMVMADGIEPSDDPVLRFRSPAYAVSFAKRLSGE